MLTLTIVYIHVLLIFSILNSMFMCILIHHMLKASTKINFIGKTVFYTGLVHGQQRDVYRLTDTHWIHICMLNVPVVT
jgi:hypothetical protein